MLFTGGPQMESAPVDTLSKRGAEALKTNCEPLELAAARPKSGRR